MRACSLAAKIYARPVGFFFSFMRAGGPDDARPVIGGRDNKYICIRISPEVLRGGQLKFLRLIPERSDRAKLSPKLLPGEASSSQESAKVTHL
jgi:hypothetical protein